MPLRSSPFGYCATVRTPLRSPTADAAVPPASVLPPPPLVSWRSFLLAPRAFAPSVANHCLPQMAPKCSVLPAPAASVDTRLPVVQQPHASPNMTTLDGRARPHGNLLPHLNWNHFKLPSMDVDNVLKPLLLGRGVAVPIVVVFLGAIGGFVALGLIGLFLGAIVLSVGYKLSLAWLDQSSTATQEI